MISLVTASETELAQAESLGLTASLELWLSDRY